MFARLRVVSLVTALGVTMATGAFLGFAFGVLAPTMVTGLGLSPLQVGTLPSVMYTVGAVFAPLAGRSTDWLGSGRVAWVVGPIVVVASLLLARATTYLGLLACAAVGGLALAASNPATNRLVADRLEGTTAGWAMGIKQAGVSAGAVIAGTVLPAVVTGEGAGGLVAAGFAAAGLGAVVSLLTVPMYLRPHHHERTVTEAINPAVGSVSGTVEDLVRYSLALGAVNGGTAAYLVLYGADNLGMSPALAGGLAAVLGITAAPARVLWARAGAHPQRAPRILRGLAVGSSVALLAIPLASIWDGLVWVAAAVLGASGTAWQGLIMLVSVRRVPATVVGHSSAKVVRAFYGGYVSGPLLFGAILEIPGVRYGIAWMVMAGLAGVAAVSVKALPTTGDGQTPRS